jgi:protein dithiol oxidoreductase (disulfide-forming)
MKAFFKFSSFLFGAVFAAAAFAQPALYVQGTHYDVLATPVRTADPNKIEVAEVFWYGCPHCYAFEPLIDSWKKNLSADVTFVRSPGMWNQLMEVHAQIFYAAEALGVLDKVHPVAFTEIHQKGNYLQTEAEVKTLFTAQGVSADDFDKTWKSFSVTSAVKKAGTRMRDYGVRGVPALIVNGKYRVTGDAGTTQADQLKIAEFLINKERTGA